MCIKYRVAPKKKTHHHHYHQQQPPRSNGKTKKKELKRARTIAGLLYKFYLVSFKFGYFHWSDIDFVRRAVGWIKKKEWNKKRRNWLLIGWLCVCVLSATGFLDEVCARVKALSLFSLAIFFFSPHNSTHTRTHRERRRECVVLYVVWAIDDAPGCRYIYTLGGGGGLVVGAHPLCCSSSWWSWKDGSIWVRGRKRKCRERKTRSPATAVYILLEWTRARERERERERLCSGWWMSAVRKLSTAPPHTHTHCQRATGLDSLSLLFRYGAEMGADNC